eukprot:snap_masked-scaffold_5-processed-gene-1.56-mRNA-1 protein AED:1.00 eAED:1.00 QI:0/-1/0/0/-1/1/1/0/478
MLFSNDSSNEMVAIGPRGGPFSTPGETKKAVFSEEVFAGVAGTKSLRRTKKRAFLRRTCSDFKMLKRAGSWFAFKSEEMHTVNGEHSVEGESPEQNSNLPRIDEHQTPRPKGLSRIKSRKCLDKKKSFSRKVHAFGGQQSEGLGVSDDTIRSTIEDLYLFSRNASLEDSKVSEFKLPLKRKLPELNFDVEAWEWNCFTYSLSDIIDFLVGKIELVKNYFDTEIDISVLKKLLREIGETYLSPEKVNFHCVQHGFSVTQHLLYLVFSEFEQIGLEKQSFELFVALVVAAFAHDARHPGIKELKKRNSSLPIEEYHFEVLFKILTKNQGEFNPFFHLSLDMHVDLFLLMKSLILNTQMTMHDNQIEFLRSYSKEALAEVAANSIPKKFSTFLGCLMHACDLSGQTMNLEIATEWEERLMKEQGVDTSSNVSDRYRSQAGFLSHVVLPLWKEVERYLPAAKPLITKLENNLSYYRTIGDSS